MANRSRRLVIDDADFTTSGIQWDNDFRVDMVDDGAFADDGTDPNLVVNDLLDYSTVNMPFTFSPGGVVNTNVVNVWGNGIASFGPLTLAQQHFMQTAYNGMSVTDFPGSFVSSRFGELAFTYSIYVGLRDFTADIDPFSYRFPIFNLSEAVGVMYVEWDGRQILLTETGLMISPNADVVEFNLDRVAISGTVTMAPTVTGTAAANILTARTATSFDYIASDVIKLAADSVPTLANPLSLDGHFDFRDNANIADALTIPHASVHSEWGGAREAFVFTVPDGGGNVVFDIDGTVNIDTVIRLYYGDGSPVLDINNVQIRNDDVLALDPGSTNLHDSSLSYTFAIGGTYIIEVATFGDAAVIGPGSYTLNISLDRARISHDFGVEGGRVLGQDGDDTLISGRGSDQMNGGNGVDTVSYQSAATAVTASLALGRATGDGDDQLTLIENLTGSALGDHLSGDGLANVLNGGAGDDWLYGGAGNDSLLGGGGIDRMTGGSGDDLYFVDDATEGVFELLNGGTADTVQFFGTTYVLPDNIEILLLKGGALSATGNGGDNRIAGNNFANLLNGEGGNDLLFGGAANDILNGGDGDDRLQGDSENDTLNGGVGDDLIFGNAGIDVLNGGAGNDRLLGGAQRDRMWGARGADSFTFDDGEFGAMTATGADQIYDFSHAEADKIRLNLVDANTANGSATDETFSFIGTAAFSNVAGQLRYEVISGNTYVQGDQNGDGGADFWIRVDGVHALVATDFAL